MSSSRRGFIKNSGSLAALAALHPLTFLPVPLSKSMDCGIQIGPDCFVDEGTEKVLDILAEKGAVNTIYLSTFTYDRGIVGRPGPGPNYPGHGVEASDKS